MGAVTVAERAETAVVQPAGFGSRLVAYVLDWLVAFILVCLFTATAGLILLVASEMGRRDPSDTTIYVALAIVLAVVPVGALLTVAGWAWRGVSVGKLAMNLRVVDRRGAPPGVLRALLRFVVYLLEGLPPALLVPAAVLAVVLHARAVVVPLIVAGAVALAPPVLSAVLVLLDPAHRALHDRVAGTTVVAD
jgi:uncharacterized RDD family membrane protein YckC